MTTPFDEFAAAAREVRPRAAVVLGSGLAAAADALVTTATISYADIPGLPAPTVAGHHGRLAVGHWGGIPLAVCFGRVHLYEGHPLPVVTRLVRVLADLGVANLLLTNAAGGIRPDLDPGTLMPIREHVTWLGPAVGGECGAPYSKELTEQLCEFDGPRLTPGVYAALTGPSYETPAEIRALRAIGVDAVGMSTAVEAGAAVDLGLTVAAVSCVTNRAAGLSDAPLSHAHVEQTALLAVDRLADLIGRFLAAAGVPERP